MSKTLVEELVHTCCTKKDKIAFVDHDGQRKTTYGRLMKLARKVEAYLRLEGVTPHSFVCIKMPNCMEFMATEMGIWLAHSVAVPMGTNTPEERAASIIKDCDSPLLIDLELMGVIDQLAISDFPEPVMPEITDDALLIYTSGSTGKPKGILHTFQPFIYSHIPSDNPLTTSADQVFGNAAPFYFSAIVFTYECLRAGGTVHLYSDQVKSDPIALAEYIKEHQINVSHISPGVLLHFHNISDSLKVVLTAGERLTSQHSKEGYTLYNLMGMTETFALTCHPVSDHPMETVPLGHVEEWVEFCIMKDDGTLASPSEDGELCVKGPFCKCYFKDPERTAQLYDGGWLHTNDIVTLGLDGLLYYRNRMDWMVKVNGQRVEPGEVEAAIGRMQGIENVVVKGFDNGKGSQYLCAFYIAQREYSAAEFYAHLDNLLPSYMQPSVFVRKDSFDFNASGKVDRNALKAPNRTRSMENIEHPTTPREKVLLQIAAEVLGTDDFGVTDNLVNLGMDSLCATKMAQLAAEKGITLKSNDVRVHQTIRALAQMQMSLLYWYKPYEEDKQTVVFCSGIIGAARLEARYRRMAEHYNLLIIEPYSEHYSYIVDNETITDIAGLYYDLLDIKITQKSTICAFMGFSFGGCLAYCMGQMFCEETGSACKVICGDAPLKFAPYVPFTTEEAEADIQAILSRSPGTSRIDAEIVHKSSRSCARIMSNWKATPTECEVLLFRCTKEVFGNLQPSYKECVKNLRVIEVEDNHANFCVLDNWLDFTIHHCLEFLRGCQ